MRGGGGRPTRPPPGVPDLKHVALFSVKFDLEVIGILLFGYFCSTYDPPNGIDSLGDLVAAGVRSAHFEAAHRRKPGFRGIACDVVLRTAGGGVFIDNQQVDPDRKHRRGGFRRVGG